MNSSQFRAAPVPPIAPSNYTAPQRREIVDESNIDPDFRPRAPANFGASSGGSPPPPPPASNVVSPVRRKEVVDPDNIDPDFR